MYSKCLACPSFFLTDWFSGAEVTQYTGRLKNRGLIPERGMRFVLLLHGIQIGLVAHPPFYPVGTLISFPGVKAAERN
jgi:hypothetical protein